MRLELEIRKIEQRSQALQHAVTGRLGHNLPSTIVIVPIRSILQPDPTSVRARQGTPFEMRAECIMLAFSVKAAASLLHASRCAPGCAAIRWNRTTVLQPS